MKTFLKLLLSMIIAVSFFSCNRVESGLPKGAKLIFKLTAEGTQEYKLEKFGEEYKWVWFTQKLYLHNPENNEIIGTVNYLTEFSLFENGSLSTMNPIVYGKKQFSPSIAKVGAYEGPSVFDNISYVIRKNCVGGKAPKLDLNSDKKYEYSKFSCTYYFYAILK